MNCYGRVTKKVLYCLAILIVQNIFMYAAYQCQWTDECRKKYYDCKRFFDTPTKVLEHIDSPCHLGTADNQNICTWKMANGEICRMIFASSHDVLNHVHSFHKELYQKSAGEEIVKIRSKEKHRVFYPQVKIEPGSGVVHAERASYKSIIPADQVIDENLLIDVAREYQSNEPGKKVDQRENTSQIVRDDGVLLRAHVVEEKEKLFRCTWQECHEKCGTGTMLLLHTIDDHFNPEKTKNPEQTCKFPSKRGAGVCGITYRTDNKESGQTIRRHIVSHIGSYVCDLEFKVHHQLCGMKFIARHELDVHQKEHGFESKQRKVTIKTGRPVPKIRKMPDNDYRTTGRLVRHGEMWFLDTIDLMDTRGPDLQYICLRKTSKKRVCGASFKKAEDFEAHCLQHNRMTQSDFELAQYIQLLAEED